MSMKRNPHTEEIIRLVTEEKLAPIEIVKRIGNLTYSQVYNVVDRARKKGEIPHIIMWGRTTTGRQRVLEMMTRKHQIAVGRLGYEMCERMSDDLIKRFVESVAADGYDSLCEAAVDIIVEHMFEVENGTEQGRSGNAGVAATAGRQSAGGGNQGRRPVGEAQGAIRADRAQFICHTPASGRS